MSHLVSTAPCCPIPLCVGLLVMASSCLIFVACPLRYCLPLCLFVVLRMTRWFFYIMFCGLLLVWVAVGRSELLEYDPYKILGLVDQEHILSNFHRSIHISVGSPLLS